MPVPGPAGYAFNRTRRSYLATNLRVAGTHWSRLRGLMLTDRHSFGEGQGLWIVPSTVSTRSLCDFQSMSCI